MKYTLSLLFIFAIFMSSALAGKYKRKHFPHWIDRDRDCQNERQETLISRSKVPVKMKINKKGKKCTVKSGQWGDFYYPETLYKASKIDIDHVVPLKNSWDSGASEWSKKKRREFANDPENLVITNLKYNRSKGAKGPLKWIPVNKSYACKYLTKWVQIKQKYNLKIDQRVISNKASVCN